MNIMLLLLILISSLPFLRTKAEECGKFADLPSSTTIFEEIEEVLMDIEAILEHQSTVQAILLDNAILPGGPWLRYTCKLSMYFIT